MTNKLKAIPLSDSDDLDSDEEADKSIQRQTTIQHYRKKFAGGIIVTTDQRSNEQANSSLSAAEKKGLKEVEELERELDLRNTFSKETNRRDEDAEMNKYIEDQLRLRREAAIRDHKTANSRQVEDSKLAELISLPGDSTDKLEDRILHSLSETLDATQTEKNEAMLSSQMLNGIPEVDLGIDEKIRTIEATESAIRNRISAGGRIHSRGRATDDHCISNFRKQHRK